MREDAQDEQLRELEAEPSAPAPPKVDASASTDIVGKLKELSQLQASGALSADEFEAAKRKLLGT